MDVDSDTPAVPIFNCGCFSELGALARGNDRRGNQGHTPTRVTRPPGSHALACVLCPSTHMLEMLLAKATGGRFTYMYVLAWFTQWKRLPWLGLPNGKDCPGLVLPNGKDCLSVSTSARQHLL
eukprot:249054-Chlamydomonas_euryale.AAC.17